MDLSFLAPVYESTGPYVSVVLDTTRAVEDAAHEIELRWRDLRKQVVAAGADERTLAALDAAVGRDRGVPGQHGQTLFGANGAVPLDRSLPAPPSRDSAVYLPIPDPLPLLVTLQHVVPYVLVIADRTGADVYAYGPHGRTVESESVEGNKDAGLQKIQGGDDANKHYQRRAENIWSENAEKVAGEIGSLVADLHAELLVVAGDPSAREKLEAHLGPDSTRIRALVEEGARAAGSSNEKLEQEVSRLVGEAADRRRGEALGALERERGRMEAAAEGIPAVVRALQRAQVGTLFLPEDASFLSGVDVKLPPGSTGDVRTPEAPHGASPLPEGGDVMLWVGDEPGRLSTERQELVTLGTDEPMRAPALPALVHAAYGTEADVVIVPADTAATLTDGVAGLLRWSDPDTVHAATQEES